MPNINLIKSFISVVEEGSFTLAAKKNKVSKTIISRHIKELESTLNIRLLNRNTRTTSLTSSGETYYTEIKRIIKKLDNVHLEMSNENSKVSGVIQILAPNSLAEIRLIPFFCDFMKKHPNLKINLLLNDSCDDIFETGFDLAIRTGDLIKNDLGLIAKKLSEENVILCTTKEYLKNEVISCPNDLLNHKLILDDNLKNTKKWILSENGKTTTLDIESSYIMKVNSAQAVKQALIRDMGIAAIPENFVKDEIKSGQLLQILKNHKLPSRNIYALYVDRKYTPKKVRILIDELKAFF